MAELRPGLGQKEPAGQGPQLSSEVPPAQGGSQGRDLCAPVWITTPEDEGFY